MRFAKNGFYIGKVHIITKVDFAKTKTRGFLFFHCFLCHKSIFSELGQLLPHPTHDSAKSCPNGRLSCPTECCFFWLFAACLFFHDAQTLYQPVYRVIVCSPESTPDASIFFFGVVTNINQTTLLFFHFVLQTADTTGHNHFTFFDARRPPQFGAPSPPGHPCHPCRKFSNLPVMLTLHPLATGEAGKKFHPRT